MGVSLDAPLPADPKPLQLNCPRCGQPLRVQQNPTGTVYRCAIDGLFWFDDAYSVSIRATMIFAVPSHYYPPGLSHNETSVELRSK